MKENSTDAKISLIVAIVAGSGLLVLVACGGMAYMMYKNFVRNQQSRQEILKQYERNRKPFMDKFLKHWQAEEIEQAAALLSPEYRQNGTAELKSLLLKYPEMQTSLKLVKEYRTPVRPTCRYQFQVTLPNKKTVGISVTIKGISGTSKWEVTEVRTSQ